MLLFNANYLRAQMGGYLSLLIGISLIATSAFGADCTEKINDPRCTEASGIEGMGYPIQVFPIRDDIDDKGIKYLESIFALSLWENDSISFKLRLQPQNLQIPKVKLEFKVSF